MLKDSFVHNQASVIHKPLKNKEGKRGRREVGGGDRRSVPTVPNKSQK